jgi:SAM-dependent methyltransferase
MSNSTTRFSDRVEDYVKYRPHYPMAVLTYLQDIYHFNPDWIVADIGSGTGISTELFLRGDCESEDGGDRKGEDGGDREGEDGGDREGEGGGNRVYAVEPNAEMRAKAEELLGGYAGFISVSGTAEATGLPDASIDLIVAGQAFHWFEPVATRREFMRIARPGAVVALIWNERLILSPFEVEYEALILEYAGDYQTINHKNITADRIGEFFYPQSFMLEVFDNEQIFDYEGLKGRLLSSSYIPKEGAVHDAMMTALAALFERHQSGGRVRVGYETKLYTGVISDRDV